VPLGALAVVVATATIVGCASRTAPVEMPAAPPPAFSTSGSVPAPARWWTAFGDPTLDALVEEALRSNDGLATAWYRLRAARALAERAGSNLFPDLDAELGATVFSSEGENGGGDLTDAFDGGSGEELRLGLAAAYEVDLWGRVRAGVEAEELRAEAAESDYRSAALSLAAEVARTWFQLLEAREQLALIDRQIEANAKAARLLENRFGGGQVRGVDILRQRQLVEATREERLVAQSRLAVLSHLLAVLLGRAPRAEPPAAPAALPELPPRPETGLPAELIQRRPDLLAAHRRLRAADRDLAVAVAERYPRLTLTASVATEDGGGAELFDDWVRSLSAGLLAPVFRAGELEAEAERAEALARQRLHEYAEATLVAWREVEDALVQEARQLERVRSLETQLRLAEQAYGQLRIEYLNGQRGYVDPLLALADQQELGRGLISARRTLLEFRIALYRALAGGFDPGTPDAEEPK